VLELSIKIQHKEQIKKKNLLVVDAGTDIESNLDVDENIFCTTL
jgi:hypothetical protein